MNTKQQRTQQELTALIMQEIRKVPQWADIVDVAITRPVQTAPHPPNWDAAFVMNSNLTPPEGAFRLVTELQNKFELA